MTLLLVTPLHVTGILNGPSTPARSGSSESLSKTNIQLTLDRYSHWMPTMGKHTASAMDEALDEADCEGAPNDKKGALER